MAHKQRKPPIDIELSKEVFNNLMQTVINERNEYLKHKLLRYSITNEENKTVTFGLFPREVAELITLIANNLKENEISINYFNTIKKIQSKVKEVSGDSE